jgi:uncharacterized protein
VALPLAGCTTSEDPSAGRWKSGELVIGTGNTTGVFYQLGAAYAYLINQYVTGYDAVATPSGGSVDNLQRLAEDDVQIALSLAGAADEAYGGIGAWAARPQPFQALARTYDSYEHVIARVDSGITSVAGMKGHKVSLGSPNSSSDLLGRRLLTVAGLDPAKDVNALPMSLPQTTAAMLDRSIDAMIWSGGLPTPGIAELFAKADGAVRFVKTQDLLPKIEQAYPHLLSKATIPKQVYGLAEDVPALSDFNLVVVRDGMPVELAYQLTKVLFDHLADLVRVTPAAGGINRDLAPLTDPVPLHPGAQRYYNSPTRPSPSAR